MLKIRTLGGKYYIDIERYIEFIADIKPNERLTNSAITETYGESMDGEDGERDHSACILGTVLCGPF